MPPLLKRTLLGLANIVSALWRLLPIKLRDTLIFGLLVLESRGDPAKGLRRLFAAQDRLNMAINERAMAYGAGIHPKHRLTRYHDFFVGRIPAGARVLDVGCGYGEVARSIAERVPGCTVLGVDLNAPRIAQAQARANPANVSFMVADATAGLPAGKWDTVVLSNILEHLEQRVDFLRGVIQHAGAERILIRVPLFERDWTLPMRRELGVSYFTDAEHFIEHEIGEFEAETAAAGLKIVELRTVWGEIWAECRVA